MNHQGEFLLDFERHHDCYRFLSTTGSCFLPLPASSTLEIGDQYPSAFFITDLSIPKLPLVLPGSTNPHPKGGFSLLLSCCCAN